MHLEHPVPCILCLLRCSSECCPDFLSHSTKAWCTMCGRLGINTPKQGGTPCQVQGLQYVGTHTNCMASVVEVKYNQGMTTPNIDSHCDYDMVLDKSRLTSCVWEVHTKNLQTVPTKCAEWVWIVYIVYHNRTKQWCEHTAGQIIPLPNNQSTSNKCTTTKAQHQ